MNWNKCQSGAKGSIYLKQIYKVCAMCPITSRVKVSLPVMNGHTRRNSLLLAAFHCLPNSLSQLCVFCVSCMFGLDAMNRTNGHNGAHFWTVCSWRHSCCCRQLCVQKVMKVVVWRLKKRGWERSYYFTPHTRLITVKWPWLSDCLFLKVTKLE